ncbi:sigma-70 family RNA polymerase sigma factor [Calidifontibacillus oryziterrae]|uniref:sigma-70 family RNA polymerase sigma factor n=1 Tax=Calidifontibacillus oryziterrae TaxID=1191699 RepID=UPI0003037A3F|nr:sigma-70 family RNA polymerase sigma factor [Calidifontibacillus oryziterrae]
MDVIERLKNKDEQALIELMNEYGDYLLRTSYLLVKDMQVAEEAVQDTFIVAYRKINQLHDSLKIKSWLAKIAINQCRARMRRWSWKNVLLKFNQNEIEKELSHTNLQDEEIPEVLILKFSRNQQLYKSIQQLDYMYREVITLFYFNQLSIEEIAALLKEKENTIKTRLRRGRSKLKIMLEEGGMNDVE